jgi:acyl-CoA thioester hydrolase
MSETPPGRDGFPHFLAIPTRWMDQDPYGHVNNVEYYSFFDTVVNEHLMRHAGLDPARSPVVGLVVETQCRFLKEITFPQVVQAGLRVIRIGRSSAVYEIGLFRDDEPDCAAFGRFVHVYVDRETRKTAPVPEPVREALAGILREDASA